MKHIILSILIIVIGFCQVYSQQTNFRGHGEALLSSLESPLEDFQVNENVGRCEKNSPAIAINSNGDYVIAWTDYRNGNADIFCQRYDNNNQPIGINLKVNNDAGIEAQLGPTVGIDDEGNFIIAWIDFRNKKGDQNPDVYCQRFNKYSQRIGVNFKINDNASDLTGFIGDLKVDIGVNGAGMFVLVWRDQRNGNPDIYGQLYQNDGTFIGGNFKVNDDTGVSDQLNPAVAIMGGRFVVVWQDERRGYWDIYSQRYNTDGTKLGDNFRVNEDEPLLVDKTNPDIAIYNSTGWFVIVWVAGKPWYGDIYAQRYDASGNKLGSNTKVNQDTGGILNLHPSVGVCPSSAQFVVVWESWLNGHADVYSQRFDHWGVRIGVNTLITGSGGSSYQGSPAVDMNYYGKYVVTWQDERQIFKDIYCQSFSANGAFEGTNFMVNDDVGSSQQRYPVMAVNYEGTFIVVWEDSRTIPGDIYCQFYDANGAPLGANKRVNDDIGINSQPDVAVDGYGNFIVVWTFQGYYSGSLIYCQRYTRNGDKIGGNFVFNSEFSQNYMPAIATNYENGNFVVIWEVYVATNTGAKSNIGASLDYYYHVAMCFDNNTNSYHEFLYRGWRAGHRSVVMQGQYWFLVCWENGRCQCYDFYNGNSIGGIIKAPDVESHPKEADISVDYGGSFAVVWSDDRNGNYDIYYQRFSADGTPVGSNEKVNDDNGTAIQKNPAISMEMGRVVIVWQDERNGNWDIYGQIYDTDGSAVGGNYQVNNNTEVSYCYQGLPDVELTNNQIYYTWEDTRNSGQGYDIYARIDKLVCPAKAPTNLQAQQIPEQIHITWNDNSDIETGYYLEVEDITSFPTYWKKLATVGSNITSYQMNDPVLTHRYVFRVKALSNTGDSDWSNVDTVYVANLLNWISVDSPNGGEIFYQGQTQEITWSTHFTQPVINFRVNIWYSLDGGSNWLSPPDASNLQNNDSYSWVVPDVTSDNCIIKIEDAIDGMPYDLSNRPFGINKTPPTNLEDDKSNVPSDFTLFQNHPNPFNPETSIEFQLPEASEVHLAVYNLRGQLVSEILKERKSAGIYTVSWNSANCPSGTYFIKMVAGDFVQTKKCVLLK